LFIVTTPRLQRPNPYWMSHRRCPNYASRLWRPSLVETSLVETPHYVASRSLLRPSREAASHRRCPNRYAMSLVETPRAKHRPAPQRAASRGSMMMTKSCFAMSYMNLRNSPNLVWQTLKQRYLIYNNLQIIILNLFL